MKNTWLEINLDDYENHMAMPEIAQSQYLANYFEHILSLYNPKKIAVLGCAGGNGLEKINADYVEKVICVDVNQQFLTEANKRFIHHFNDIEFICHDISSKEFLIDKVDLIYAALVLEYVDVEKTIFNISKYLEVNGILSIIIQLPNENIPEVSPSKYKSLEKLGEIFHFVESDKLIDTCQKYKFTLISKNMTELKSGKCFAEFTFRKMI